MSGRITNNYPLTSRQRNDRSYSLQGGASIGIAGVLDYSNIQQMWNELRKIYKDLLRSGAPCRPREKAIERKDNENDGNWWKGGTDEEVNGCGWRTK